MAAKSNLSNMLLVLTGTCLICSALLAGVYSVTAEPIAQTNNNILMESISAVVPDGVQISDAKPLSVGGKDSEYYECSKDGSVVAYAIKSEATGFGGALTLMVGITTDGIVYNASVLSHSEPQALGRTARPTSTSRLNGKGSTLRQRSLPSRKTAVMSMPLLLPRSLPGLMRWL